MQQLMACCRETRIIAHRRLHSRAFTLAGVPFAGYANFGMAWDSVDSKLVMWDGTGDIWTINPDAGGSPLNPGTWGVTELTPSLGEMTPFETSGFTGVLGEWDYIPSLNIFLGVTVPDINGAVTPEVWAYKLDASPQPRPPKKKLDVSLDLPEQLDVSLDFPQQNSTTPEPASISIVLAGTGLAFLMRRRRTS